MELLGTGRLAVLLGNPQKEFRATAGTVAHITEAAGKLSQQRRGALIVVDLGSDLRPEDFLNPGVTIELSSVVSCCSTCSPLTHHSMTVLSWCEAIASNPPASFFRCPVTA